MFNSEYQNMWIFQEKSADCHNLSMERERQIYLDKTRILSHFYNLVENHLSMSLFIVVELKPNLMCFQNSDGGIKQRLPE